MKKRDTWLRWVRKQKGSSLRRLENGSAESASDRRIPAPRVSAGWLGRFEPLGGDLSFSKLCALAAIYGLAVGDVLASCQNE